MAIGWLIKYIAPNQTYWNCSELGTAQPPLVLFYFCYLDQGHVLGFKDDWQNVALNPSGTYISFKCWPPTTFKKKSFLIIFLGQCKCACKNSEPLVKSFWEKSIHRRERERKRRNNVNSGHYVRRRIAHALWSGQNCIFTKCLNIIHLLLLLRVDVCLLMSGEQTNWSNEITNCRKKVKNVKCAFPKLLT